MSYSIDVPTKNYLNWPMNSGQLNTTTAFLNFLFNSLKHSSGDTVDMYTLFQICNIPLIVAQKLIANSFKSKNINHEDLKSTIEIMDNYEIDFLSLKNEEFISGFHTLYYGNNIEKTKLIANLCSFNNNLIYIKDVKLLLSHLHMRFLYDDENETTLKKIILNFFEEKENYTVEEFIIKSIEKNYDIVYIFLTFFQKFKFFNDEQIKLFELSYLNHLKIWKKANFQSNTPINNTYELSNVINNETMSTNIFNVSIKQKSFFSAEKINEFNISKEAEEYTNLIKKSNIEYEPFETEDNEMRKDMENFDKDLINIMSSLQNNLVKVISFKPCFIEKEEIEKMTKKALSPINTMKKTIITNKENQFTQVYQNFYVPSESDEDNDNDKYDNSNFLSINNTNTLKNIHSNIDTFISNTLIEKTKFVEIKCFKLAKTLTKFKRVKLILADNIIYYYSYDSKLSDISSNKYDFKLKSMIIISQLFPSIINNPLIPNNLYNSMNLPDKNTPIYQYQIFSTLHNKQLIYNFFFNHKEDIQTLDNHIKEIQHLRDISKYYNMKSNEIKEIGSGHFGKVILCSHNITEEKLAIKTIHKHTDERNSNSKNKKVDENIEEIRKIENFKCIQWEKDIFTFLSHLKNAPNIIKCYEYFENLKYIFYVNEYCSGGNLKKMKLPKNITSINQLSKHLISGLYTLHSYGIIHRDIKCTNTIICERDDGKNVLKIIDFGLSKVMGINEFAYEGYGSLPYKSPEQLLGKKYSFPVDIWALGITIYWLIHNHFPVSTESKHKMKKLIIKYDYKDDQNKIGNENIFFNKLFSHTLVNDYRKRAKIIELMKYKEVIS